MRKELNRPEEVEQQGAEAEEVLYKIDIPANRYDMLCVEGIARALNVFKQSAQPASYVLAPTPKPAMQQLIVKPETALVSLCVLGGPACLCSCTDVIECEHQGAACAGLPGTAMAAELHPMRTTHGQHGADMRDPCVASGTDGRVCTHSTVRALAYLPAHVVVFASPHASKVSPLAVWQRSA